MNFGRVLTAMVTPFNPRGEVDYDQTTKLIEYLIEHGTDGLVIAGTTGESPTLTSAEKIDLFKHVVKVVNKRIPVIAGTGSNSTATSISLTKEAEACGVDGIMLVAPYYNKPSQQGMVEHFSAIAKITDLPIMLYNIPGRSVVKMTADTIVQLSKVPGIVSIKDATGDMELAATVIEKTEDDFSFYSGEDSMTLPLLSLGAIGVVSVVSHVAGEKMQEMASQFHQGNIKEAASIHRKLLPTMKAMFMAPSPAPVKSALRLKGIETGRVRLPLTELSKEEEEKLQSYFS
ncbi:4-hydroxy-tetrahydrodipicolinate synthase [Virgibacillus halodenitrificans]|uniref:4-hydroxy-tetrahydrodipicolinate synthase n=1 Tax=Virgibacillus halodenitrificans TaxID=1482 RepID=A0AAC9NL32_VIRHA|nr:4-hydroxy-tetrahydrodipicolinate synthase [Virgibacillus halodenitrificans]APC48578.1 4-hydroxy-tetrahydrodipicolinate synthase [Virgibacillus halodenitrificans]MBD1224219.1 4-hydroxy-tetrahydrodipicolinate synthase [Virgibacillus halodenitrificans]MCG1028754.1 4-hydroxy-tetrahydrodipicolinate synthase [Virgibacillus halodenitrificans]MCJ0931152.1 4-hydroxy-tetrahydrodipicolinate synthase [Virgibacillus halodenitrificans]MEC2161131.1 4-hydroxy-tetrahydrodipicolinate synthase [Virgibacillus 